MIRALAATLALAAPAAADELAARFGARPLVEHASLSPDGRSLAYVVPLAGQGGQLRTIRLDGQEEKPVAVLGASGNPERLADCEWVDDQRLSCILWGVSGGDRPCDDRQAEPQIRLPFRPPFCLASVRLSTDRAPGKRPAPVTIPNHAKGECIDVAVDRRALDGRGIVRLAAAAPFALGPLAVDPPTRQVRRGDRAETLEPRAMQVLVALGEARGQVVSRDTLVDRCWDGRIVGDDSINRVIAQLRRLAGGLGADAFTIETVTKVGYRLVVARPVPETPEPAPAPTVASPLTRRGLLVAAAAGAAAAGGAAVLLLRKPADPLAPARLLIVGRRDRLREAEALIHARLREAPNDGAALGLLALAHARSALGDFDAGDQARIEAGRAAVARALAHDPNNADALVAQATIQPLYGNWRRYEAAVATAAARFPDHWFANYSLAVVRYHTGRYAEALAPAAAAVAAEALCASSRHGLALVQWSMGDLAASEATQLESLRRFPDDNQLFQQRFDFLALTGRPGEARALGAVGLRNRPAEHVLSLAPGHATVALDALEFGGEALRRKAIAALAAARDAGAVATFEAASWIAMLGAPARALALLPSYFMGKSPPGTATHLPPDRGSFLHTCFLFMPPMATVWPLPGFGALLAATGLENFWTETGTTPDFRR